MSVGHITHISAPINSLTLSSINKSFKNVKKIKYYNKYMHYTYIQFVLMVLQMAGRNNSAGLMRPLQHEVIKTSMIHCSFYFCFIFNAVKDTGSQKYADPSYLYSFLIF